MTQLLLIGSIGIIVALAVSMVLWQRRKYAKQLRTEQLKAEQLRAEQLRAEQLREEQARAEQLRLERLRDEEEKRAFYEIVQQVVVGAQQALHELQRIREQDWPHYRERWNAAADGYLGEWRGLLAHRVPEVVNGEFFWSVAKATLPHQGWKDEFNEYVRRPEQQLLNQQALKGGLVRLARSGEEVLTDLLQREVKEKSGVIRLDQVSGKAFGRLKAKPERLREMIGPREELKTIFQAQVLPDLLKGGALIGAGLLIQDSLDGEWTIELLGTAMGEVLGNEVLALLTDEITNWIIAEVGEQVFLECAETLAVALTGFGMVIVLWKAGKYAWLAKRLFYDQEPLQKMRENVFAEGSQSLVNAGNETKRKFEERIAALLENTEAQLKTLHGAAAERADWALKQLSESSESKAPLAA